MDFDTNVENYTTEELLSFLDIENHDSETIERTIEQQLVQHASNPELVQFYKDIQKKLIDPKETAKVFETEVKKGNLNPDLKNTVSRMINVDSLYRENPLVYNYDVDNYVFQLNEPISNVISLMLYSVEIPQSWYTFSTAKGNTLFSIVLIEDDIKTSYTLQINDGNYTPKSLMNMMTDLINGSELFNPTRGTGSVVLEQDAYTGRLNITINYSYARTGTGTATQWVKIGFIFHAPELVTKINHNLGWNLGFRLPVMMFEADFKRIGAPTNPQTYISAVMNAHSLIDTAGPKYIILKLDDFKPNRLNKSLVCINTKMENAIKLPSYYNKSLSQYSVSRNGIHVQPSIPASLTLKQQYTINSISESKLLTEVDRIQSPDDSDIFAKIPLKRVTDWGMVDATGNYAVMDNGPGKLIIEWSGPLQLNVRDYFGPVNINAFSVSLYDDKGMLLGLNGMDWSFTMIAKSLYQY